MSDTTNLMSTGMDALQAAEVVKQIAVGPATTAASVTNGAITTLGATVIPAGTVAAQLQAIADLADPAA